MKQDAGRKLRDQRLRSRAIGDLRAGEWLGCALPFSGGGGAMRPDSRTVDQPLGGWAARLRKRLK